jgi:AraC-like DNA-binding protein
VPSDPLSDVLRSVRLTGAVFYVIDCFAPFVAEAPAASEVARRVMPGSQQVFEYHAVTQGVCWGGIVGEEAVRLEAGDVILFVQGDPHVISSAPGMRATPRTGVHGHQVDTSLPFLLTAGEEGPDRAQVVCGFLGCDARPFNPLLATLPRVLHARDGASGRLRQLMQLALAESRLRRIGGETVLSRVSELMFVEVVRCHLEALPPEQTGWLAGLRDAFTSRALGLLHGQAARPWTLDALAREVGLSRSALAERFTHFVGQPPMQYLARWRMHLAAGMLRNATSNIAEVASDTGYLSEAAFSRAFKKLVGVPPAAWRRQAGAAGVEGGHGAPPDVPRPPARRGAPARALGAVPPGSHPL